MKKKAYIETYGCQMNVSDSEIVLSILKNADYEISEHSHEADVILLNTCAIRENAEEKIYHRLKQLKPFKRKNPDLKVAVLGCMATHEKEKITQNNDIVNVVLGPDQYRKLPDLLAEDNDSPSYELDLSKFETYADIYPTRKNGVSGWISITRGCNNFCSYCVVPYTRGRERSRSPLDIIDEVKRLRDEGFKEVYLLGQNVNSYKYERADFADLLELTANVEGIKRIKFITSHPKDFNFKLVDVIAAYPNISKYIHLPFQAGSDRILKKMNRRHKIDEYLQKIDYIKRKIPNVGLSTDIIVAYPTEAENEFMETVKVCEYVKFDSAFVFKYSPREGTKAYQLHPDDVPENEKVRRLMWIDQLTRELALPNFKSLIGTKQSVLIEGYSKKSRDVLTGKIDRGLQTMIPNIGHKAGDFVDVSITDHKTFNLIGEIES